MVLRPLAARTADAKRYPRRSPAISSLFSESHHTAVLQDKRRSCSAFLSQPELLIELLAAETEFKGVEAESLGDLLAVLYAADALRARSDMVLAADSWGFGADHL